MEISIAAARVALPTAFKETIADDRFEIVNSDLNIKLGYSNVFCMVGAGVDDGRTVLVGLMLDVDDGAAVDGVKLIYIEGLNEGNVVGDSEGTEVDVKLGTAVGRRVENFVGGFCIGVELGMPLFGTEVGRKVGTSVTVAGSTDGRVDGIAEGVRGAEDGLVVGPFEGFFDIVKVGVNDVGVIDGSGDGSIVGTELGSAVGLLDGL